MTELDDILSGMRLWPHHVDTIARVSGHFAAQRDVEALLLTGSLAHGFATEASDVDIVIVISDAEWQRRRAETALTYYDEGLATYDGGYVDGKFVSLSFLREVAERGNDATRWGYDGARILFSRTPELVPLLDEVVRFPLAAQAARRTRFTAQLLAWRWYGEQGREKDDPYLQGLALSKVVLFASRLVLNENALLFPFHKWMRRLVQDAAHRPASFPDDVAALYAGSGEIDRFVCGLLDFYGIDRGEAERTWGAWFLRDTELSWLSGPTPVEDL